MLYNTSSVNSNAGCQLVLSDSRGVYQVSSTNIIRLQAQDNYTIIYFRKQHPFVVSKVLKTYEEMLAPYGFVRTHRSHLINTSFVSNINHFSIIMQDASVVDLAKRNKTDLRKKLVELVRKRTGNESIRCISQHQL